jgi:hypothetical protein
MEDVNSFFITDVFGFRGKKKEVSARRLLQAAGPQD